jgi:hypothetical protein
MIFIEQGKTNVVCLTLTDVSTIVTPKYLFKFIRENDRNNPIYFASPDLSAYRSRYNLFEIEEDFEGANGGVDIPIKLPQGQYVYEVYQTATLTDDPDNIVGDAIEIGRMLVVGNSITNNIYD